MSKTRKIRGVPFEQAIRVGSIHVSKPKPQSLNEKPAIIPLLPHFRAEKEWGKQNNLP